MREIGSWPGQGGGGGTWVPSGYPAPVKRPGGVVTVNIEKLVVVRSLLEKKRRWSEPIIRVVT